MRMSGSGLTQVWPGPVPLPRGLSWAGPLAEWPSCLCHLFLPSLGSDVQSGRTWALEGACSAL